MAGTLTTAGVAAFVVLMLLWKNNTDHKKAWMEKHSSVPEEPDITDLSDLENVYMTDGMVDDLLPPIHVE